MPAAFRSWKLWFSLLILAGLIALVESTYGWMALLLAWQSIPPAELILAILLMLVTYVLRAFRFQDFFSGYCSGQTRRMLRITVLHNFFNTLLPMRSGEASFPLLMKQHFAIPVSHSAPALIWLRLLDLYALLSLGAISQLSRVSAYYWALLLPALFLPLIALPLQNRIRVWCQNGSGKATDKLLDMMTALPASAAPFVRATAWTLLNWSIKLAVFSWLLQAFLIASGQQASYESAWMGATTGELSSVLPIHGIAGAGTYEAGILAGLLPFGIDSTTGLAAAVNLHLFLLGSMLLLTGLLTLMTHSQSGPLSKPLS